MSEKLPKPMLDALARAAKPAEHPSADLLAAFVESSLAEAEARSVAEHLAGCSECREVVFLASNATEEPVNVEEAIAAASLQQEWMAVAMPDAALRSRLGRLPQPAAAGLPEQESPRKTHLPWWARLVWAGSIAAVLVVAASLFVVHWSLPHTAAPVQMASRAAQPNQAVRQPTEAPPSAGSVSQRAETEAPKTLTRAQPKAAGTTIASAKAAPATRNQLSYESAYSAAPLPSARETVVPKDLANAAPESGDSTLGGATTRVPAAAPPRGSGFAPSNAEVSRALGTATSGEFATQKTAINLLQSLHPGWRVTAEGHLEHHTGDGWSQVLADQKNTFRVVALLGPDVWAGGNGGMLFHSGDGGQNWKKVVVQGIGAAAIVSIRFDDWQNGLISADSGESYATADGGATWVKQ